MATEHGYSLRDEAIDSYESGGKLWLPVEKEDRWH